uniref:Uncharacterized protein n=1 Tax=Oryza sativa subsp. japonica TaxID=39947 RepID=Q6Z5J5_ORYSJ|nr:hypothetical protein [Oryza sativa Japonica Group]
MSIVLLPLPPPAPGCRPRSSAPSATETRRRRNRAYRQPLAMREQLERGGRGKRGDGTTVELIVSSRPP